jgi:hypothetical protein
VRFDVKNWPELDKAVYNYRASTKSEPMILVFHTPGQTAFRFIINQHGIVRQECDSKGETRYDDL